MTDSSINEALRLMGESLIKLSTAKPTLNTNETPTKETPKKQTEELVNPFE
jgi:hypothetical protein